MLQAMRVLLPHGRVRWDGFQRMKETHIRRALRLLGGHTYVEIGVSRGACFRRIEAPRKIAVAPAPVDFGADLAPHEALFRLESDRLFERYAASLFRPRGVDVTLAACKAMEYGQLAAARKSLLRLKHHWLAPLLLRRVCRATQP